MASKHGDLVSLRRLMFQKNVTLGIGLLNGEDVINWGFGVLVYIFFSYGATALLGPRPPEGF